MGDCGAERPLGGAHGIGMDPLEITRRVGDVVDALLVDREPCARTEARAVLRSPVIT